MSRHLPSSEPAFPVPDGEAADRGYHGMSLRDWFAGQALIGIMLNESAYEWAPQGIATRANLVADAMLAARKREGQS